LPLLVLTALIVAVLLRTFVVQVFFIPSSSMVPTLAVDDRIVVEKVTYRFREPRRGEVVVFAGQAGAPVAADGPLLERTLTGLGRLTGVVPPNPSDLVKRVVGLPGEEIAIVDGVLQVDGTPIDEPYLDAAAPADFAAVTVPDGALFFLGDNRRNSADSRGSLGFVARERVVGRALGVIWPLSNARSLTLQDGVQHPGLDRAQDGA
jgi:signal peptidase I